MQVTQRSDDISISAFLLCHFTTSDDSVNTPVSESRPSPIPWWAASAFFGHQIGDSSDLHYDIDM